MRLTYRQGETENLATMDEIYDEKTGSRQSAAMRRRTAEIQARPVGEAER